MLSVVPDRDTEVALTVVRWWQRLDWHTALVAVAAALHLLAAFTLIAAPDSQLFTQGTRPVFALLPPPAWAVLFVVGGVSAASLLHRVTPGRQWLTWLTVLPTQVMWVAASVMAVTRGGGSAMFVVFLLAVLAFTGVTAGIVAHDSTTGKR